MIIFIGLYLLSLVIIALVSKRLISSEKDYLLAGRSLPLSLSVFALFATWFGSETILGATQEVLEGGFIKVIEEPFGAALCLILAGLFIVKPLYRMNLLTFGDFFKVKYGEKVEVLASFFLIISYFGWIAAQYVAFGLVLKTITGLNLEISTFLAFLISLLMTFFGGMWSVALTDFIQTIVILISIFFIFGEILIKAGGLQALEKIPSSYFNILPELDIKSIILYIVAWITIGLGSLPGQDLFQRFMSSKSEDVAYKSSIIAGFMYLTVAVIPLITVLVIYFNFGFKTDKTLLDYVYLNTSPITKYLFFAGLLSAILSTATAAILAPSALLSENIIKKFFNHLSDLALLNITRLSVFLVALISLLLAYSGETIYNLVGLSSVLTLVSLFAPFIFGLYWKKANSKGALASMVLGFLVWFIFYFFLREEELGIFFGFIVNILAMVVFSLIKI
jgi:Na+/proline symporter